MLKRISAAFALVVLLGVQAEGQSAQDAMALIRAADAAIGASRTKSIHYAATDGYIAAVGEGESADNLHDRWPRFELKSFSRTIDYETMSMREEQVRTQGVWPADRGGGGRPIVGERRIVAMYRDGFAWDVNPDGSVTPRPREVAVRRLEMLMTPQGFVRAALKATNLRLEEHWESFRANTRRIRTVSFLYMGKYPVNGWINADNQVTRIQTWFPTPFGSEYVETRYGQYRDYGGFQFGPVIHQNVGNPPDSNYDFRASTVQANVPNAAIEVPAAVRQAGDNSGVVTTQMLAPGVWLIGGDHYHSVAVEFADFLAVVEAPLNEARSEAVMNEVHRLVPAKPLRYVVNTHHHIDVSGGLRAYGAEDILIVTHESNATFYEGLALSVHAEMLEPDRLARTPRQVHYIRVQDRETLTDGKRALRVQHIESQNHATDMLVAYLPTEGILIEADLFERPPAGTTPPATLLNKALLYNLERAAIAPTRIVSIHDGEIPMSDFLRVVGRTAINARGSGFDADLNQGR